MKQLLYLAAFGIISLSACKKTPIAKADDKAMVETELDAFVANLTSNMPADVTALEQRITEYMNTHDYVFYGSTVTVLNPITKKAAYSPYVYRETKKTLSSNHSLMDPSYKIDEQAWLRDPIDQNQAIWTEPYFDEGGGDVWMQTHSVPIYLNSVLIGVATTDVRVKKP